MEKYSVKLDKIRFRNDDLFTIAVGQSEEEIPEKFRDKGLLHQIVLKGYFPPNTTSRLVVYGGWEKSKYGFTFNVKSYEEKIEMSKQGIINYLVSSISGIGKSMAQKIYAKFGEKTFEVFDNSPEELLAIKGISEKKLVKIMDSYNATKVMRDLMLIGGESITPKLCGKIYKKYGDESIKVIKKNPYALCDIHGISFLTADKIGRNLNSDPCDVERIRQGLIFVLRQAASNGSVCMPQKQLITDTLTLLNHDFLPQPVVGRLLVVSVLKLAAKQGDLQGDNGFAYLRRSYEDEVLSASLVREKVNDSENKFEDSDIERYITEEEKKLGITLHSQQREAVKMAVKNSFCIITGGPGTGKSTILMIVIEVIKKLNKRLNDSDFLLVAPTGKAARRMAETTHHKFSSSTIHSALGLFSSDDDEISGCEIKALPNKYVLGDEASMIDNWLFARLMSACDNSNVILLGDPEQLPSVGAGNVLADLLRCENVPKVKLNHIYRQADTSSIAINAQMIRYGNFAKLQYAKDFRICYAPDEEAAAETIVNMFKGRQLSKEQLNNIQVLSPMKKAGHPAGCFELNRRLQEVINPYSPYKNQIQFGGTTYRTGDKVIQLKNDTEAGVNNGDTGFITLIEEESITVDFGFTTVDYDKSELENLSLAYAISIHKSQGSEFKTCIIPCVMSFYIMLCRNLIYTGITRAKKNVILVGDKKALSIAISNNKSVERYTQLEQRVSKLN